MTEIVRETAEEAVALVRIDRPLARNALNMAARIQLAQHFRAIAEDNSVRAVVLTGNEQVFAAGADLREFVDLGAVDQMLRGTWRLWKAIADCPKPVIAAVNGFALGGGMELAMHADIIVAGEGAQLGQPEVKVGIMPGAGGTQRLIRAVGKFKAMRMILTGEPIGAAEALAMGLVSEVVADGEVLPRALELARKIARLPPLAIQQIKEVTLAGEDAPLETAMLLERKAFHLLFATADKSEGMNAFLEKRRPVFKGR